VVVSVEVSLEEAISAMREEVAKLELVEKVAKLELVELSSSVFPFVSLLTSSASAISDSSRS